MSERDAKDIQHEGTLPSGRDLYTCSTCGMSFSVSCVHETPTKCPWGGFHP